MDKPKKTGGKPSNRDLLAERKLLASLMEDIPGETNEQRVQWLIEDHNRRQSAAATVAIPITPEPVKIYVPPYQHPDDGLVPMSSLPASIVNSVQKPKDDGPVDRAHYPEPGEPVSVVNTQRVNAGPPQATSLGDLTPQYVRWFLSANGPEATRAKYTNRIQHLPGDVRAAIA